MYPADLPVAEGLQIVEILRNNEIVTKKALFGYNVWLLQGYIQKTILGDPNNVSGGVVITPQHAAAFSTMNVADELEKICNAHQAGTLVHASLSIPWQQILIWALGQLTQVIATGA